MAASLLPCSVRSWNLRHPLRWGALAVLMLLAPLGCSLHDDPHYNPYAPTGGDPTLLRAADELMNVAGEGVDNLQRRLDNIIAD
ncbi:MAG: hypothetical protein IPM18_16235 [Phycisphaerales bacterium]|nr:hypothetical protein [Phycisphaerales bacterium]